MLADDSHEISFLIFFENWENLLSAAVVIRSLRVNSLHAGYFCMFFFLFLSSVFSKTFLLKSFQQYSHKQ